MNELSLLFDLAVRLLPIPLAVFLGIKAARIRPLPAIALVAISAIFPIFYWYLLRFYSLAFLHLNFKDQVVYDMVGADILLPQVATSPCLAVGALWLARRARRKREAVNS